MQSPPKPEGPSISEDWECPNTPHVETAPPVGVLGGRRVPGKKYVMEAGRPVIQGGQFTLVQGVRRSLALPRMPSVLIWVSSVQSELQRRTEVALLGIVVSHSVNIN